MLISRFTGAKYSRCSLHVVTCKPKMLCLIRNNKDAEERMETNIPSFKVGDALTLHILRFLFKAFYLGRTLAFHQHHNQNCLWGKV